MSYFTTNRLNEYRFIFNRVIVLSTAICFVVFAFLSVYSGLSVYHIQLILNYHWSMIYADIFNHSFMFDSSYISKALQIQSFFVHTLSYSLVTGALSIPLIYYCYAPFKMKKYIRGSFFTNNNPFPKQLCSLPCGKYKIPVNQECRHFFVIGRPGTGKTLFMLDLVNMIKQNNSKCLIYDFKGDFIQRFYDPTTDIIYNPVDNRSVYWNFFDDIETDMEIWTLKQSLQY